MSESNAQIEGALLSPREPVNSTNQAGDSLKNTKNFNAKTNLLQQNAYQCDANAGVADSHWKVVVWESQTARLGLIDRVVSGCGAQVYRVEELGDIQKALCSSCCAAVVALGTDRTDETLASKVIGRMKQAGLTVIAHEQGARSWSLALRCRVLLDGALCVLDSEESGFSQELRRIMTELIAQKSRELLLRLTQHNQIPEG